MVSRLTGTPQYLASFSSLRAEVMPHARHNPVIFWPLTAIMGLHLFGRPENCLPMTSLDIVTGSPPNSTKALRVNPEDDHHNFTVTFAGQRDLVEPSESESLNFAEFSVHHVSTLQSLFESGSHIFDPFVHFLQSLAEGVSGSPRTAMAAPPPPRDKRMLYIA